MEPVGVDAVEPVGVDEVVEIDCVALVVEVVDDVEPELVDEVVEVDGSPVDFPLQL